MRVPITPLLFSFLLLQGCGSGSSGGHYSNKSYSSSESADADDDEASNEGTGGDGEEVADEGNNDSSDDGGSGNVHYYNPNTGTQSDYTLDVEHDGSGDVERINFDHGGYIDESHIADQEHNGDGTITVATDKGYEYTVDESENEEE